LSREADLNVDVLALPGGVGLDSPCRGRHYRNHCADGGAEPDKARPPAGDAPFLQGPWRETAEAFGRF